MKTFLLLFLAGFAAKCVSLDYIVQVPPPPPKEFKVYWNVPTFQCRSKKILFKDLFQKYGIVQNTNDSFIGDRIAILYNPGEWPELTRNKSGAIVRLKNGGVPQEGDVRMHLEKFQKKLVNDIPDEDFSGIGVIDFEKFRPVFRQNFANGKIPNMYRQLSLDIERERHEGWDPSWIEEEATRRFEINARQFMQTSLWLAKKLRPKARWGYYAFPFCFNMNPYRRESCAENTSLENDDIDWLWKESTVLFPSVYNPKGLAPAQLPGLIRGRVKEAARVAIKGSPILPYFSYVFFSNETQFFNESELEIAFDTIYDSSASGFVIWGSSNDVNTLDKCQRLKKYVDDVLGPTVAKYTNRITEHKTLERVENTTTVFSVTNTTPVPSTTETTPSSSSKTTSVAPAGTADLPDKGTGRNVTTVVVTENPFMGSREISDNKTTTKEMTTKGIYIELVTYAPGDDDINKKTSDILTTSTTTECKKAKELETWWALLCKLGITWIIIFVFLLFFFVGVSVIFCCNVLQKCHSSCIKSPAVDS